MTRSLPPPYRAGPGMLLPTPSEREPLRAAREPCGNTRGHLPDRRPPREAQMTKITSSSKRNRDSSKVSMRGNLKRCGKSYARSTAAKERGGRFAWRSTYVEVTPGRPTETNGYIQYGIACVHEQPPATAPGSRRQFGLYSQRSFVKGFFVHHKRLVQQVLRHLEK